MKRDEDKRCVCYIHCGNRNGNDMWNINYTLYCNDCGTAIVNHKEWDDIKDIPNWKEE